MDRHPSLPPLHPGELLKEDVLPALGKSQVAIAELLGISRQTLIDILHERQAVTSEMAVRLGKLLGNGAEFWNNLQAAYDLHKARQNVDVSHIPTLKAA